jgi:hypothetical protein
VSEKACLSAATAAKSYHQCRNVRTQDQKIRDIAERHVGETAVSVRGEDQKVDRLLTDRRGQLPADIAAAENQTSDPQSACADAPGQIIKIDLGDMLVAPVDPGLQFRVVRLARPRPR